PVRPHELPEGALDRAEPVAVFLVNGFFGLGVHTLLSVQKLFLKQFKVYLFVFVGVIDLVTFKGVAEIDTLKRQTIKNLQKYVTFTHQLNFQTNYQYE